MPKIKRPLRIGQYEVFQNSDNKYKLDLALMKAGDNFDFELIEGYYLLQVMQPSFKYWLVFADNIEQFKKFKQRRHAYLHLVDLHAQQLLSKK